MAPVSGCPVAPHCEIAATSGRRAMGSARLQEYVPRQAGGCYRPEALSRPPEAMVVRRDPEDSLVAGAVGAAPGCRPGTELAPRPRRPREAGSGGR